MSESASGARHAAGLAVGTDAGGFYTLKDTVNALAALHGSLRAVARHTGIDVSYLSRLAAGEKANPSKAVLTKLGLRRVVLYESLTSKGTPT